MQSAGKIGFLFGLGHGHYTQFLNFQECCPPELAHRAEWIPLRGDTSGDLLGRLPLLPAGRRFRRHQTWNARAGVARHRQWDALFFAAMQVSFLPILRRHRCYLYTDLTPSLRRELAPWYDHKIIKNPVLRALRERAQHRLFHTARGIFTMSRWAADGVCRDYGVPRERVHVVHPGANLNRWPYIDRADRPANRPTRILMVGGQFQLKGGLLLLEWAEKTRAHNWEMDIVTWPGELPEWAREALGHPGPDQRVSGSLAPRLPGVRVHCGLRANTPEIMRLFAEADLFCLPTQADGSSIASLEAMASGLPVLVGGVGGIPELIEEGVTGLLLKRGDRDDLAAKLEGLMADRPLRLRMGCAARKSCEDYYNVTRQVRDILAAIDRDIAEDSRLKTTRKQTREQLSDRWPSSAGSGSEV